MEAQAQKAITVAFGDWESGVEPMLNCSLQYLRELMDEDELGPLWLHDSTEGMELVFVIHDENIDELLRYKIDFDDLIKKTLELYEGCYRSEADLIIGLERRIAAARSEYEARNGFSPERADAKFEESRNA